MRNGIWLLVGAAPELKGWRTLLRIDDFWEVWRSGQSVIIWYPSCLLEICFFRGVRTGKMWLIPHLSFFLLVLVFQALVLQGTRVCTLLVVWSFFNIDILERLPQNLLRLAGAVNLFTSANARGTCWKFAVILGFVLFDGNLQILRGAAKVANPSESVQQEAASDDQFPSWDPICRVCALKNHPFPKVRAEELKEFCVLYARIKALLAIGV